MFSVESIRARRAPPLIARITNNDRLSACSKFIKDNPFSLREDGHQLACHSGRAGCFGHQRRVCPEDIIDSIIIKLSTASAHRALTAFRGPHVRCQDSMLDDALERMNLSLGVVGFHYVRQGAVQEIVIEAIPDGRG